MSAGTVEILLEVTAEEIRRVVPSADQHSLLVACLGTSAALIELGRAIVEATAARDSDKRPPADPVKPPPPPPPPPPKDAA